MTLRSALRGLCCSRQGDFSLALLVLLVLAAPVAAEEAPYTVTPLGDRWYLLKLVEPVTLGPGEATRVTVWLDEVPGGVDSSPMLVARPMSGDKAALTLSNAVFAPVPYDTYPVPLVAAILRNDSAATVSYRIKAYVRGKD